MRLTAGLGHVGRKPPGERPELDFGATIYDQHDNRKRVLTIGDAYLVKEDGEKRG